MSRRALHKSLGKWRVEAFMVLIGFWSGCGAPPERRHEARRRYARMKQKGLPVRLITPAGRVYETSEAGLFYSHRPHDHAHHHPIRREQ